MCPLRRTKQLKCHSTVLRNLTKKIQLQNPNWDNVICDKSAWLNRVDPWVHKMPHPSKANWNAKPDVEFDQDNKNHRLQVMENLVSREGMSMENMEKRSWAEEADKD